MFLTEQQWKKVLPLIKEGAKELEIHLDEMGNAVVFSTGSRVSRPPLKLRGNVIPFPKVPRTEHTLKDKVMMFLQELGVVFGGYDDEDN